ncbi:protein phosphatase 2A regulatory subunit cdc55 [Boothiomyces macroporosus]|uniref:Protein phosphatase PP2A regulatory subunit B n=1 Tax=Boothiomyces macroporosus TaxID=261099 RepID=A0AAD5YBB0_9FUNG|nr:protein phosphatase 2A regulatory subunit cdc55 [Boothiomyces macroporosus]
MLATDRNRKDPDNGWKFSQCFGEKAESNDIVEVQFDHTGDYLATGDYGGRIVLFERNDGKKACEYRFLAEFQSHLGEFDYLKSCDIEERINRIAWLKRSNNAHMLLSTNDKTIKLWKISSKSIRAVAENNLGSGSRPSSVSELKLPKSIHHDTIYISNPKRIYQNAHQYNINAISVNSDGEHFISSDDLRVMLWNMDITQECFSNCCLTLDIVDLKQDIYDDSTDFITCSEMHPISCNMLCYSTARGKLRLLDMRQDNSADDRAKVFENPADSKSFFSDVVASVSDVKFSPDGRHMIARDYMTIKLWDLHMESQPIKTMSIHDHLESKFCDLYDNDVIFDRFGVNFSGDGTQAVTGSYSNFFHAFNMKNDTDTILQADKSMFRPRAIGSKEISPAEQSLLRRKEFFDVEKLDYNRRIFHTSWHPKEDTIALAATNNLFLFHKN